MLEMAATRQDHGDAMIVAGSDYFGILYASAGLNDGSYSCGRSTVNRVGEGEEGVGSENRTGAIGTGLLDGDLN